MRIGDDTNSHARRLAALAVAAVAWPALPDRRRRRGPGPAVAARAAPGRARAASRTARACSRPSSPATRTSSTSSPARSRCCATARRSWSPSSTGPGAPATARRSGSSSSSDQLRRSLNVLRNRLVEIYRSGEPDAAHRDPRVRRLRRPGLALRVPAPDRGAGRRRSSAACATLRNGTRDTVERVDGRPRRDRRQEGRARAHPGRSSRPARPSSTPPATSKAAALDEVAVATSSGSRATSATSRARSRRRSRRRPRRRRRRCPPGPIQGAQRRLHLAGQRPGDLAVRLALGPHARGHRHRRPRGHPDPRRARPGT